MRYDFVERHRGRWPVRLMCRVLRVSAGGYYDWRGRPASARTERREALDVAIKAIHGEVKARYGSPRVHAELVARGMPRCVNTVAQLMRTHGIAARTRRKFRVTTDSNHDRPVAENLALEMALARRQRGAGLVVHSDRGSQYASEHYQRLLLGRGITCSMSRRGNCWDNAPMESFFASLKKELTRGESFATSGVVRVHRGVLQPDEEAFLVGKPLTSRVRTSRMNP